MRALIAILITPAAACAFRAPQASAAPQLADTVAIARVARILSADSLRGRGPWTPENANVARYLAAQLEQLGARPVFGNSLLVPFTSDPRPRDTVFNVAAILPATNGSIAGERVGITAHFDHLGVGRPDSTGDAIYNGLLDAALPVAMVLDVARRYARQPGRRPLIVLFFNLEEQGLLGSKAMVARPDARTLIDSLRLLIGVDAGSPAGEAIEWQLMGGAPEHWGTRIADSLARARGWTTTSTPPRAISDVFPFAQNGVPILFPIPGRTWRNYTDAQRSAAMAKFDHYHQPSDEWRTDFPLVGTAYFTDWLWSIVDSATR
ncbi:MAG TPA: M28 family peptidase [Gemmatimonadaceae bacterium]|nr:M28 family peptidase [Gemmatimonadaceae bacterium]